MKQNTKRNRMTYSIGGTLAVIAVGLLSYAGLNAQFLPNATIGQVSVAGLNRGEALQKLKEEIQTFEEKPLNFNIRGEAYRLTPKELGVTIDVQKSIENAYAKNRSSSFLQDVKTFFTALWTKKSQKEELVTAVDSQELQAALIKKVPELDNPERVAVRFINPVQADREGIGYTTDYKAVSRRIIAQVETMQNDVIDIPLLPAPPEPEPLTHIFQGAELLSHEDTETRLYFLNHQPLQLQTYLGRDDLQKKTWKLNIHNKDGWLRETRIGDETTLSYNPDKLREYLEKEISPEVDREVEHAYIREIPEEGKYAKVDGVAKDGRKLHIDRAVEQIIGAVSRDHFDIILPVEFTPSFVLNYTGKGPEIFQLLGSGRSNFVGSPEGRAFNIKKGLNEHFNNVILRKGEMFSNNSYLGGPVTYARGWKPSKGIFGDELQDTPGGGLCQVSTTIYRAAVQAGLDIRKRNNHSWYVHYYVPYGDGLDAAIFPPGGKDITFYNDTESYMLVQAYTEGDDAIVNMYGASDGRKVALEGPFRWNQVPEGTEPIRRNEILWLEHITRPDGTVETHRRISGYGRGFK